MRQYDLDNSTGSQPDAVHYRWYEVWVEVFTRPAQATFQRLLLDPQARAQRAYLWVFLAGAILGIPQLARAPLPYEVDALTVILLGPIMGAFGAIISFIVQNYLLQRVALMMEGKGDYGSLHYARGTFIPALALAQALFLGLFGGVPLILELFGLVRLFIEVALTVIALQAVNRFHNTSAMFATGAVYMGLIFVQILLAGAIL